jgi:UDP-glucose/iron transport system permease protein
MNGYISLQYLDLVWASSFLVLNAILSATLRLGITRSLIVSAARMTVQLLLVGLALKWVFAISSLWLTLAVALVMGLLAAREIWARQTRRLIGVWGYGLGATNILFAGGIVMAVALTTQIQPDPWYAPRFLLPMFGMILGNTMTGISLGLDTLVESTARDRRAVEARLLLGHTRWEAMRPLARRAISSGFMPIINAMAATGIVSLPGMMTGQILAGADPTEAVKYQVLIMFLIGGATGLGVLGAVMGGVWRLTDERDRLRLDRLSAKAP